MDWYMIGFLTVIFILVLIFLLYFYRFAYRRGYHTGATHVLNDWKWHMGIGVEPERDEELPKNVVRMNHYREHDYYDE